MKDAIDKIEDYTNANLLALNPEKNRVMIMTKNPKNRNKFSITVAGKKLVHQPALTILGNVVSEDLSWDRHIISKVIPSLANRVRTLKNISQYMGIKFRKQYATALFRGKLKFCSRHQGRSRTNPHYKDTDTPRQGCKSCSRTSILKEVQSPTTPRAGLAHSQG